MGLTQIHVDAAREQSAQFGIHHFERHIVRSRACCSKLIALQGGLGSTRPVDENQARIAGLERSERRARGLSLLPPTELLLEQGFQCLERDVSGNNAPARTSASRPAKSF